MQQTFDDFVLWLLEFLSGTNDPMGFGQWLLMLLVAAAFILCAVLAVRASALRMFKGKGPGDWINLAVTAAVAVLFALPALLSIQWGFKPALAAASVKLLHLAVLIPASLVALAAAILALAVVPAWRGDTQRMKSGLGLAGLYAAAMVSGMAFLLLYSTHGLKIEVFFLVDWLLFLILLIVDIVALLALIAMAYFGVRAMLNGFWLNDLHPRLAGLYKAVFGTLFLASVWLLRQAYDTVVAEYGSQVEAVDWSDVAAVLPATTDVIAASILIVYGLITTFVEIPSSADLLTGKE